MIKKTQNQKVLQIFFLLATLALVATGIILGLTIAAIENTSPATRNNIEPPALPSQIFDRKGRLITEFFSEEKRELVSIHKLPKYLIYALITREDNDFFEHSGFSVRGVIRAAWNLVTGNFVSGGSTITQQLAGHLYADRRIFSIQRKLRELWWALQLERNWSKYEILETYLNTMNFGHGNYGVEAASQYYFGRSARNISIAESCMLVIQLANPSLYSPIRRPNSARIMQRHILDQMILYGYVDKEEAEHSFDLYWKNYDFNRSNTSTAFFERESSAGHFSEHVRYVLENEILLGSWDINRDGLSIYTTLDLDFQEKANQYMEDGITQANLKYLKNSKKNQTLSEDMNFLIHLLGLSFNIQNLSTGSNNQAHSARIYYRDNLNSIIDMLTLSLGTAPDDDLRYNIRRSQLESEHNKLKTTVEGALITIENETGYVVAMIGGSKFEARNQFNRALDAYVEPGSSFKPLYYAAAIEHKVVTPATMLYDSPVVFWNDDNTPYKPENYRGKWAGKVLVRQALANSMNVPSLKVLERVGFTNALDVSSRLLGIPQSEMISRNLVRKYPVGLGIVSTAPIEMARAYSTFANEGREVVPIMIRYIEDRNRQITAHPELEILKQQEKKGDSVQLINSQTAYIMADMLQSTVKEGTLRYAMRIAGDIDQPIAGKTGTTQNWADAWTVGFTPYYTTAVWLGFDRGGKNSLGVNQTGAITAGPIWSQYMHDIHEGLPRREFARPDGISERWITEETGELLPANYDAPVYREIFISGTEPQMVSKNVDFDKAQEEFLQQKLTDDLQRRYSKNNVDTLESNILRFDETDSFDLDLDVSLTVPNLTTDEQSSVSGGELFHLDSNTNPLLD